MKKSLIVLLFLLPMATAQAGQPPAGTGPGSDKQEPLNPKEPLPGTSKLKKTKPSQEPDAVREQVEDAKDEKK